MFQKVKVLLMVAVALFVGSLLIAPESGYSSGSVDECEENCE
jgi:hypothetical protein